MKTISLLILAVLAGRCALAPLHAAAQSIETMAPVVVKTVPEAGSDNVAPGIVEIRVTFSKEMADDSWTWSSAWKDSTPEIIEKPHYEADGKTCVIKVKLEPNKTYGYWLNSQKFAGFQDTGGRAAVPYLLTFKAKSNGEGSPRIGVYDSRSVATAYAGSVRHETEIRRLDDALTNAKASRDPAQIKQADGAVWAARTRLHRQGLGTDPVDDILGQITDEIGRIKKALRLTALVSKWDERTLTKYSKAEQIDVTEKLIDALEPGVRQRRNAIEIQKKKPIHPDQLEELLRKEAH